MDEVEGVDEVNNKEADGRLFVGYLPGYVSASGCPRSCAYYSDDEVWADVA
jgi:hypothetical protein